MKLNLKNFLLILIFTYYKNLTPPLEFTKNNYWFNNNSKKKKIVIYYKKKI